MELIKFLGAKNNEPTALDKAIGKVYKNIGCVDVGLYLINCGYSGNSENKVELLCGASYWGKLDVVKELLEQHSFDPSKQPVELVEI